MCLWKSLGEGLVLIHRTLDRPLAYCFAHLRIVLADELQAQSLLALRISVHDDADRAA